MAADEFPVDNWVRATGTQNRAKVVAHILERQVQSIFPRKFRAPLEVSAFNQQGWTNIALLLRMDDGVQAILRLRQKPSGIGDAAQLWSPFHREHWVYYRVCDRVPVPAYIEPEIGYTSLRKSTRAQSQDYAFSLHEYLPYASAASRVPVEKRVEFIEKLARLAKKINETPSVGYGKEFDAQQVCFRFPNWKDFLSYKVELCGIPSLVKAGLLSSTLSERMLERMRALEDLSMPATLAHLDFLNNWGNVLIDESLEPRAIIDWEYVSSGPGVFYELASTLYVWARDGKDESQANLEFEAILRGYEITPQDYEENMREHVECLMLFNALGALKRYMELLRTSSLEREPWREVFAKRSQALIARILKPH